MDDRCVTTDELRAHIGNETLRALPECADPSGSARQHRTPDGYAFGVGSAAGARCLVNLGIPGPGGAPPCWLAERSPLAP